jgi:hypothetical protein
MFRLCNRQRVPVRDASDRAHDIGGHLQESAMNDGKSAQEVLEAVITKTNHLAGNSSVR